MTLSVISEVSRFSKWKIDCERKKLPTTTKRPTLKLFHADFKAMLVDDDSSRKFVASSTENHAGVDVRQNSLRDKREIIKKAEITET